MRNTKYKSGFSLIEVLFAVMLVGLAIASLMAANGAFTKANGAGTDLSTAEFLIGQIRELSMLLPVVEPGTPESGVDVFGPQEGHGPRVDLLGEILHHLGARGTRYHAAIRHEGPGQSDQAQDPRVAGKGSQVHSALSSG